MEVVTTVATVRSTTEQAIAEDYTYRQLRHVGETYVKDRMMVMRVIGQSLVGGKGEGPAKKPKSSKWKSLKVRRSARPGYRRDVHVVDIDKELDGAKMALLKKIMTGGGPVSG